MNTENIIYFTIFFLFISLRNIAEKKTKRTIFSPKTDNHAKKGMFSLGIFISCMFVSWISAGFYLLKSQSISIVSFITGMIICSIAFAMRIMSLKTISSTYSQMITPREDGRLITSGIYSVMRNPLYFFYSVEMLGLLLIVFNYFSLISFMLVISASVYRSYAEEKLLAAKYKKEFELYRKKTKRLIPFIF